MHAGFDMMPALDGINVLLVEDEMMVAMDIEFALQDAGALVVGPVDRVSKGVKLAADDTIQIDLAILDVDLHGEAVFPVAEVLRRRGVPFLFHTGHATRAEIDAKFPGAPVCRKPMMVEHLIRTASRLLG
ncbi:MAG: response regulator [Deltaproteobacteria bacterium]